MAAWPEGRNGIHRKCGRKMDRVWLQASRRGRRRLLETEVQRGEHRRWGAVTENAAQGMQHFARVLHGFAYKKPPIKKKTNKKQLLGPIR
jgi:hypothetical protein